MKNNKVKSSKAEHEIILENILRRNKNRKLSYESE